MSKNYGLYHHPEAKLLAVFGAGFLLLSACFSGLAFKFSGLIIPTFLFPYVAVFLWPRWSDFILSPILIALGGLFIDLMHGNLLGLSSILFLVLYVFAKPREREERFGLWQGWTEYIIYAGAVLFGVMAIYGVILGRNLSWRSLLLQFGLTTLLFPAIYYVRNFLRQIVVDPQDAIYRQ